MDGLCGYSHIQLLALAMGQLLPTAYVHMLSISNACKVSLCCKRLCHELVCTCHSV